MMMLMASGIHSERFYEVGLWNYLSKEGLKDFMKLDLSSKRMDLDKTVWRASLVVQWLRICLLMQGTRVRALVWEDPTCRGATGPVSHNY